MKILHLISSLDAKSGGTSWACARICQAQAEYGDLPISIAYTFSEGDDPEVVEWLKSTEKRPELFPIGPTSARLRRHPTLADSLGRLVKQHDVVHIHGLWEEIQWCGHRVAARLHKPIVLSPHGMLSPWSLGHSSLKKRAYWFWRWGHQVAKTSCIHSLTLSEQRQLCWVDGVPRLVEPLGIDFPLEESDNVKGEVDEMQFLFLSRLHPGKNLHFLLDVLSKLLDHAWHLKVAGGGSLNYVNKTKALIQHLGLSGRVELLGQVNATERESLLRSSHLMLLPSEHENFGIVVLEALSRKVQVLLSPEVGLTEELRSSSNVTIQPIEEELWGKSIQQKLELFKLNKNDAKKAFVHDWGADRFNWHQIGNNWCRNYAELVERLRIRESKA